MDHAKEGRGFMENQLPSLTFNNAKAPKRCSDGGGKIEMPDEDEYSPLVSLLKSKASTIKV